MNNRFFTFVHTDHSKLLQIVEAPTSHVARARLSKELPGSVSYKAAYDTVDQARAYADHLGLGVEIWRFPKKPKDWANNKLMWYGFQERGNETPAVRWFIQASSREEATASLLKLRTGVYIYDDVFDDIETARNYCARNMLHPLFYPDHYIQPPTENKFFRFFGSRNDTWYYAEAPTRDQAYARVADYTVARNETLPQAASTPPHNSASEAEREAMRFKMNAVFFPYQKLAYTKDFRLALNNKQVNEPNLEQRTLINALFPKPFTWAARRIAFKNALEETFWILFGVLGVSLMVCCLTLVFWAVYMLLTGGFSR